MFLLKSMQPDSFVGREVDTNVSLFCFLDRYKFIYLY